jgi:hypothetical protein
MFGSLVLGRFLLTGHWVWTYAWSEFAVGQVKARAAEFFLGGLVLALGVGLVAGLLAYVLLKLFPQRRAQVKP